MNINSNLWLLISNLLFWQHIEPDLAQYWDKACFQAIFPKLTPDLALWPIWMKINSYLFFWPQIYCFGSILDLIWSNNDLWVILTHGHVITSFWFTLGSKTPTIFQAATFQLFWKRMSRNDLTGTYKVSKETKSWNFGNLARILWQW